MKLISVSIKGVTPLLQHRFSESTEQAGNTRKVLVSNGTPREQAEKVCYRSKDGKTFYHPGASIGRLLREAGSNHKLRGSRKSAKYVVPAAVLVPQDTITILNGDGRTPAEDFEVDSRPVVIPSTKGRIMRHRPRFDVWSMNFSIRINDTILDLDFIHALLNEGGEQIGIGDFRPEKGGPFGVFLITEWKEQK